MLYAPTRGSSAYKIYEQPKHEPAKLQNTRKARLLAKSARRLARAKLMFFILLCTSMAFFILFRYAQITESCKRLESMRAELAACQAQVEREQKEIDKAINLRQIEETAINKLGMRRPEKHQIVYITAKPDNRTEVVKKEDKHQNYFSAIIGQIGNILEYLY